MSSNRIEVTQTKWSEANGDFITFGTEYVMHLIDFTLTVDPGKGDATVWASVPMVDDGDLESGPSPDGPHWYMEDAVVQIACVTCSGFNAETAPLRLVVWEGVSRGNDPTAYYELACGHTVL